MPKHTRKSKQRSSIGPTQSNKKRGFYQYIDEFENYADQSEEEHGLKKTDLINEALTFERENNEELKLLALQDGGLLQENKVRMECWRRLLKLKNKLDTKPEQELSTEISRQIDLDVARSYGNISQGASPKRSRLKFALRSFFRRNPTLHYYQGFHDVFMVILEVFNDSMDYLQVAECLSHMFVFKDAHAPDFSHVQTLLQMIENLVSLADSQVALPLDHTPFWGVSMLLTCFAHDVPNVHARLRIFDALIASQPHFPLYLVAALPLLPDIKVAVVRAEDSAHALDAVRTGACKLTTVRKADLLVRTARALMEKVPVSVLLANGEKKFGLSRSSFLFQPFPLDPLYIIPPPLPAETPKEIALNWFHHPTSLKIQWRAILRDYWAVAVLVAILAASSYSVNRK